MKYYGFGLNGVKVIVWLLKVYYLMYVIIRFFEIIIF